MTMPLLRACSWQDSVLPVEPVRVNSLKAGLPTAQLQLRYPARASSW